MKTYFYIKHTGILSCVVFFLLYSVTAVDAVACPNQVGTSVTISSSCAFTGTVVGADSGSGAPNTGQVTIQPGATLTVGPNQTMAYGSIVKNPGGKIILVGNAILKKGRIYIKDEDADNYPSASTPVYNVSTSIVPSYSTRAALVTFGTFNQATGTGTADCNDTSALVQTTQTGYSDNDADTYALTFGTSQCLAAVQGTCNAAYRKNTSNACILVTSSGSDCNDSNAGIFSNTPNVAIDRDQDGYYASAITTACAGAPTTVSGRTYYYGSVVFPDGYWWLNVANALGGNDSNDTNAGVH